jgi:hypothetical protein
MQSISGVRIGAYYAVSAQTRFTPYDDNTVNLCLVAINAVTNSSSSAMAGGYYQTNMPGETGPMWAAQLGSYQATATDFTLEVQMMCYYGNGILDVTDIQLTGPDIVCDTLCSAQYYTTTFADDLITDGDFEAPDVDDNWDVDWYDEGSYSLSGDAPGGGVCL